METTTIEPVTEPSAQKLTANTMCLVVRTGVFGNTKQASLADVTVAADKKLLRMSKMLLDSPELKAVSKFDAETGRMLRTVGFPSMLKSGVHLIAVAQVESTDTLMKARAARRAELVEAAIASYDSRTVETSTRLGVVYNPADYPSKERFASAFYSEWQWVAWDTPSRLKAISVALFNEERQKASAHLASVAQECQQAMRAGLLKLVEHLSERLTDDGEEGKTKRFKAATVTNLQEFLDTFALRDVTEDTELAAIVQKARAVMAGVDATAIKGDDLVRQKIQSSMAEIKGLLEPIVVDVKTRRIDFEDD